MTTAMDTTRLTIRDFEPTDKDYEGLVALDELVLPDYKATVEGWRHDDSAFDTSKYYRKRIVAVDSESAQIIGWGEYNHMASFFHPDRYWFWILVHPDHQRQGVGSRIYDELLRDATKRNALYVLTNTSEQMAHSISFVEHRGFYEVMREWESRIDPQEFDSAPFQGYMDRFSEMGLVMKTLAELKETDPEWLQKVYELHVTTMADVPATMEYTRPPLDLYVKRNIEAPHAMLDAYFVALDGDRYVSESFLVRDLAYPEALYQALTGTLREYRGKGVATALKVAGLDYAKAQGYNLVKTWNSTQNTAMLAVNVKLGYKRLPAWIDYEKKLREE